MDYVRPRPCGDHIVMMCFRPLLLPRGLKWRQGKIVTAWWTIRGPEGDVQAIIVLYVDDFMIYGGPHSLVVEIADIIQGTWETSDLTFLGPQSMIRFQGMEVQRPTETSSEIRLGQQGYISELLRLNGVKDSQRDRVPITKELASSPDVPREVDPDIVRQAQQITGEILWVAQRTRPDLSFATCMMASMCSRCPLQTIEIGNKVLRYLQSTISYGLSVQWKGLGLTMHCDAAFAPQGMHSHGGWLVSYGGAPIVC